MTPGEMAVKFNAELGALIERSSAQGVAPLTIQTALEDNAFEIRMRRLEARREMMVREMERKIIGANQMPNGKG